jgi:hypothetical protein
VTGLKALAGRVPGGLFVGYVGKTLWRQSVVDPYLTYRHRRLASVEEAVRRHTRTLHRDGIVEIRDYFPRDTLALFQHECAAAAERVEQGLVDRSDLTLAPGGSYRLAWRRAYGEAVERLFFANSYFETVARFYLGGPVKHVYTIFQRSRPFESPHVFGGGQHFHFDYERRTFKAFLYLTDVALENGPLVYCRGTSRIDLLKLRKLARMHVLGTNQELALTEDEARRLRLHERAEPLTGSAGTLLFAETRGYHKAARVTQGWRDVLVLYYGRA